MAASSIEFDVNALIGQLSLIESTQIKYAGTRAMQRLGFALRGELAQYMSGTFRNPVPFTLASPIYTADGLQVKIEISRKGDKGQDPGRYLYPVSTEDTAGAKPSYPTRFAKALWRNNIVDKSYFPIPWLDGRAVPVNDYGNVPKEFYSSVLAGLKRYGIAGAKRTKQAGYQIFSVPDRRIGPSIRRTSSLKPGIYRVKGSQLDFLFGYARRNPIVRTSFDFANFTFRRAEEILPTILSKTLADAIK